MKMALKILVALAVVVALLFALNSYIYQEKQAPEEQAMDLSGTSWSWQRTELVNGGRTEAPPGNRFVLSFEDGRASSTTDCNSLSGDYKQRGSELEFDTFAMTKMFCEGSVEMPYVEQLSQIVGFSVDGETLRLSMEGEQGTMTFVRVR